MKMRKTIKKEMMKKIMKTMTEAKNIIKYYIIKILRYYYSLIQTASEIY
jgi:hypothetical protein